MEITMPATNPSAAGDRQPADVQQLIGLLGNLMPLLIRFQAQTLDQFALGSAPSIAQQAAEHQAAVNFVSDITAISLRNVSTYLETNADGHAGLAGCVPVVAQAERSLAMRDYSHAFELLWQAYRMITFVRATDPEIPPLQMSDKAAGSESGRTRSAH
jgi:hypothetical protein